MLMVSSKNNIWLMKCSDTKEHGHQCLKFHLNWGKCEGGFCDSRKNQKLSKLVE